MGISGVYNVPALAESAVLRHLYVTPAFGQDAAAWKESSPTHRLRELLPHTSNKMRGNLSSNRSPDSGSSLCSCDDEHSSHRLQDHSDCRNSDYDDSSTCLIKLPKFLFINAMWDFSLLDQAREFEDLLKSVGVEVERYLIPSTDHFTIMRLFQDRRAISRNNQPDDCSKSDLTRLVKNFVMGYR